MIKKLRKSALILTGFFWSLLFSITSIAGIPVVANVMVTDVTTQSFSVIWISSEASQPSLTIFSDEEGLFPATGIQTIAQPVKNGSTLIQSAAEDLGVMKLTVTGLLPNTTYYYQAITTSKASADITLSPVSWPFPSVKTQTLAVRTTTDPQDLPFSNDLIVLDCFLPDGTTPAQGSLLVAQVAGSNYAVSEFVGDSITSPEACVDLNNIFSNISNQTLALSGGESLTLTKYMGIYGTETKKYLVPAVSQLALIKKPDLLRCYGDFDGDADVDSFDIIIFVSEFNSCTSDCNADFEPDSDVDSNDLTEFAAAFGKTSCQ